MALVIAGIDEAGYGPLLGPLCIGMSVFRVEDWTPGDQAPCLWKLLTTGVCRKPSDKRKRVAVNDSKRLKGPNDRTCRHPLAELERGALAFLNCVDRAPDVGCDERCILDSHLYSIIGAEPEPHHWYQCDPTSLPVSATWPELLIAANLLKRAMTNSGVNVLDLRCRAIGEAGFNRIYDRTGTKSAATGAGITRHLRRLWNQHALLDDTCEGGARIVCDAQGGRTRYEGYLAQAIPGCRVTVLEESSVRSRYVVEGEGTRQISEISGDEGDTDPARRDDRPRAITILFQPEADGLHFPVALASMLAKFVRELMMMRFNRYWQGRIPELKPTAGYTQDARRWLADVGENATHAERTMMIRRA
ncbi:MAG: hypothetical protein H7210_10550 [Pyrinomonadaceae bacterium]|nr:hypothetical protein [Phycisphaerales bacterium]